MAWVLRTGSICFPRHQDTRRRAGRRTNSNRQRTSRHTIAGSSRITPRLSRRVRESASRPRVEESFGEGPLHRRPNHFRGPESSQPAPIRALTDSERKPLIEGVATELNGDTAVAFVIERKGGNDTLQSHVVDEIFCIAREALTNAFRHSEASRIAVELDYQRRQFRFNCSDNGRGFDSAVLPASQANGHWGLRGMAERAEKIEAKFSCASSPDKGTDVQVLVPARRAYARTTGFRLFSSKRGST